MVTPQTLESQIGDSAPKIINLSDYEPSPDEISLLKRGLKFCPTPLKPDLLELEVNIAEFVRKLELTVHFSHSKESTEDDCLIKKKSDFQPLPSRDPYFSNICHQIKDWASTLNTLPTPKWKNNILPGERRALDSLEAIQI